MKEMSAEKVQEFLAYLDQQIEHQWKLYRSAKQTGYDYAPNEECEAKRLEQTKSASKKNNYPFWSGKNIITLFCLINRDALSLSVNSVSGPSPVKRGRVSGRPDDFRLR